MQLLSTHPNLKIDNLRQYLKKFIYGDNDDTVKYKSARKAEDEWEDEEAFQEAISEIINNNIKIKDKFGRSGLIALTGEYLRFIPDDNLIPNVAIQKQYVKTPLLRSEIDLKNYITRINEEHKKIIDEQEYNYEDIINTTLERIEHIFYGVSEKFNVKYKFNDIAD